MKTPVTPKLRPVTREELEQFVAAYPRPLTKDAYAACEPAYISFNDFTRGDWPASIVASYSAGGTGFRVLDEGEPT